MKKKHITMLLLLLFHINIVLAQEKKVTGNIVDDKGTPLLGVTIIVKGTTTGTQTDFDGNYTISCKKSDVLVFSYIGFKNQEKIIADTLIINITMEEDATLLNEVLVVGYGKTSKVDNTGAITKIKSEELDNTPVASLQEALSGKASGVFIESQSGKIDGAIKVRIRGTNSIGGNNEPLYVVDGLVIAGGTRDINFNNIESIEVLKDAAATAIYGSRGANGVILITTKKGKQGKTQFRVDFQNGFSEPTNLRDFMNAEQYRDFFRVAAINRFGEDTGNLFSDIILGDLAQGQDVNTDWQDLAFRNAKLVQFNVGASGGSEKSRFYTNLSYDHQEGILIGNDLKKLNGILNFEHDVNERASVGISTTLSRLETNSVAGDNAFATPIQLVAQAPISPIRDEDGNLISYDQVGSIVNGYYSALIEDANSTRNTTSDRILANLYADYKFTDWLNIRGELGLDRGSTRAFVFQNANTQGNGVTGGFGSTRITKFQTFSPKIYATIDKKFNEMHDINVVIGTEAQKTRTEIAGGTATGFISGLDQTGTGAVPTGVLGSTANNGFYSYFGRATYKLNNKYIVGFTGRYDESSAFDGGVFFPAVSAAWKISEESFLKDSKIISFMKLRSSYGINGNNFNGFPSLALFSPVAYNKLAGLSPTQLANNDLSWETTATFDVGLELGFFDNRINLELNYYKKQTKDLIQRRPIDATSGFTGFSANVGNMENKGLEITLNTVNVDSKDFSWETNVNFSKNENRVTKLINGQPILSTNDSYMNALIEGEPIGVFYGREYAGVDPANGDALYYLNDGTGGTTNNPNAANFKVLGSPNPDWIAGITNQLRYKNIDVSFLFNVVQGNKIHKAADGFMVGGSFIDNQLASELNYWTPENPNTDVPQPRLLRGNGTAASSRFLQDGSYIRLKNISLGYNFGPKLLEKIKLTDLRIYITGQNLLTFTKYDGWDPEVSTDFLANGNNIFQGVDFYSAPQAKTVTLGVKVGF
ncbi:TonB-dependent receptor [uncultured Kordia sp.]|uniref:SusC/RagA family TonB-linked outer membrane protein n=1 Tax=uncultured Kordia sp. TaxID=507699 RepID=UPI00260E9950|nr:TonB-dependent receptor [uncultured Kordia sp.]